MSIKAKEGDRKYNFAMYVATLCFLALFWGKLTSGDAATILGILAALFPMANMGEHAAKAYRDAKQNPHSLDSPGAPGH